MAISEQLILDLGRAQAQIDDLERQLDGLLQPIDIPVNIQTTQALDDLRRDIQLTDAEEVDVDVDVGGLGQADDELGDFNRELRRTEDELEDVTREADRTTDAVLRVGTRGASVFSNLRGSLLAVGAGFVAFQGLQAVSQFFGEAIQSSSDLEQSIGGVQAIFAESTDIVLEFGEDAAQSVGLAQSAFNALSSQLGGQLQAFGFGVEESAEATTELIELGADLAATYGGPVSQAVEAIGSLLRGERNPIERYGVALNEATIQAEALDQGLADTASALTLQDKALASLSLLYEQTTGAQGQFAREADTTAGALERIRAQFEEFRAEVGDALLPVVSDFLELTPQLIESLEGLVPVLADIAQSFASSAESGGGLVAAVSDVPNVIGGVIDVFRGAGGAIINFNQAAFDLVTLDFSGFAENVRAGLGAIADLQVDIDLRTIREDLIDLLQAGEDPLEVLAAGIAEVGQSTGNLERFRDEVERIFAITGLEGADAAEGLRFLIDNAEDLGLSADESAALLDILTSSLQDARDAALLARPEIRGFAEDAEQLPTSLIPAGEAVDGLAQQLSALERVDFSEALEGIEAQFAQLPDGLDAAAAALRDEENEIVTDFTDFLDDLDDQIAARQAFRDNLAILESLGLDNLAQVFRTEGLDAAAALADAVANPAEAQRAEDLLDENARDIAKSFREELAAEIQDGTLDLTIPVNINAAIQELIASGLGAQEAVEVVGASGAGPNVGGGVTVNNTQIFEGETVPTTDTARAAQIVNGIIASNTVN